MVKLKDDKRHIICIDVKGQVEKEVVHKVLKVNLKHSKEDYILDLASAQLGSYRPVAPSREYLDTFATHPESKSQKSYFGATQGGMMGTC